MESLTCTRRGFPQGRLAIMAGRGLLNHLVHPQPCGLFPIAKPPPRLNYLRDRDSHTAPGKALIVQSISRSNSFGYMARGWEK